MNKDELKDIGQVARTQNILIIKAKELLTPNDEGIELNEGYEYELNGALPQIADGFAKMLVELDKDNKNIGGGFLTLIEQYYIKLKAEK